MKKFLLILTLTLPGCTVPENFSSSVTQSAQAIVDTANAFGIDPWQADEATLAKLHWACLNINLVSTLAGIWVPGFSASANTLCAVALNAAQSRGVAPGLPGGDSDLPPPQLEATDNELLQ